MSPTSALHALGTALGDVTFVQGAGGNVSVKSDDALHVKASGTRLRTVGDPAGFATVPLAQALAALDGDEEADTALFAHRPRPSLETYFHALPGTVVAHTHPVRTSLLACSTRPAPASVDGIPLVDVPYVRPGRVLALVMRERQPAAPVHAFLLRNHGLVVVAPTADVAIATTLRIDDVLGADFAPSTDFGAHAADWLSMPVTELGARVARTLPRRTIHVGHGARYLFPDAVVYGFARRVEHASIDALRMLLDVQPQWFATSTVLEDDEGRRLAIARDREQLDRMTEILAAHDWLERTLASTGDTAYLAPDEPAALLDLPAEKFRQGIGASSA